MQNYKSNTDSYRAQQAQGGQDKNTAPKLSPVVQGVVKKESAFRKVVKDRAGKIKKFAIKDVIVPTAKRALIDVINIAVNGDSAKQPGYMQFWNRYTGVGSTYSNVYRQQTQNTQAPQKSVDNMVQIVRYEDLGKAKMMLSSMEQVIAEFGRISISQYYDLCGLGECALTTDVRYGWRSLKGADTVRCMDGGYILQLPPVVQL